MIPRVLIVAENASARFGGEAFLPLHYFRLLRERGADVHLLAHSRTRTELMEAMPSEVDRIWFIPNTNVHRRLWNVYCRLPSCIGDLTAGAMLNLSTQLNQLCLAKTLIDRLGIHVLHQPIPVSPKDLSLMCGLGVPVVIGPLNGGMEYPPAFCRLGKSQLLRLARSASHVVHRLARGKLEATTVLVANERTRRALPQGLRGKVIEMVENGVDFARFDPHLRRKSPRIAGKLRAMFLGRLVACKVVDIAIEAIAKANQEVQVSLDIVGDGPMRHHWEDFVRQQKLTDRVTFHGFVPQDQIPSLLVEADVLALPSLRECGGAVVLEAMALGVPVVASAWGGPMDYLDATTGDLIEPTSREDLISGFAASFVRFAHHPEIAVTVGSRARTVALSKFDWQKKIDRIIELYSEAIERYRLQFSN